uniref:SCO family protein n=1 Tax=Thermorudis peleae TaxID=1382356 RepID=A0A831TDA1_9BACT
MRWSRQQLVLVALVSLLAASLLGVAGWWWRATSGAGSPNGVEFESPRQVPALRLQGSDGREHSLQDFRGKVVLVYFGYTTCPDACPMTLGKFARVKAALGERAEDVQVVMVTVDPQRDTAGRLREYLAVYGVDFLGLTGDEATIQELAAAFGVYYAPYESDTALGYLVEHTTSSFILDRQGRLRILAPYDLTAEQLAEDVRYLLRRD